MTFTEASLINNIRKDYPATHEIYLQFKECTLKVSCNTKVLQKELSKYFSTFQTKQTDPDIEITVHEARIPKLDFPFQVPRLEQGKTRHKEEFFDLPDGRIVRKLLTEMVFIFGKGQNLALGPCENNPNQVINFVNNRFIEWELRQGALLGHAAGVYFNGRGLALAGFSGMGKSTLALHLMSRKAIFVSNDRLLIHKQSPDTELQMTGVPKLPRINPGTALNNAHLVNIIPLKEKERIQKLPANQLWHLEQKYDVDIQTCFGKNRFLLSSPMHGLVILNWQKSSEPVSITQFDPAKRIDLIRAFIKHPGLFFYPDSDCARIEQPTVPEYISMLSNCTLLEISGGINFEQAADACLNFLQNI